MASVLDKLGSEHTAEIFKLPRGPIFNERSGSADLGDKYNRRLLAWRDAAVAQGIGELRQNPEYDSIQDYISMIEGDQWFSIQLASWRSKFTDNRMSKARIDALAYLTDIKPSISVTTQVPAFKDAADVLKRIIQQEWRVRRLDMALEEVIDQALLGTGFWKLSCFYPGEFSALACGMDTVIPIQQGKDLQDSVAVLYRSFKPPHYFKQRWADRSVGIEKEAEPGMITTAGNQAAVRPWGIQEFSWNTMSPSMKYHKMKMSPGPNAQNDSGNEFPLIEYQEFWIEDWHINETSETVIVKDPYLELDSHNYWYRVAPGQRLYPRKRLLIFGGNRVMYDGPSPYWHGLFPFIKLRLNPVIWASGGLSLYRDLKPLQISINRVGAGIENVVEKAIKPIVISKDGAVPATSWEKFFTDKAGSKLKLLPIANPATDVRFIEPPQLPQYVEAHRQYVLSSFRDISGQMDIASMGKKKQVPGGDTVEQFKDLMTTSRRRELRNIELFLEDAGRMALPCVSQFFSRDQRMRMLGDLGLTKNDFDWKPGTMYNWAGLPQEFYKNFAIEVEPGSMHAGSKDRQKLVAMQLAKQGAISLRELHRQLEILNSDQILQEISEERKMGLGPPPPKGKQSQQQMSRGARNAKPV